MAHQPESLAGPSKRKVSYFFDDDVGAYLFSPTHPMKSHRIKMTHNLVVNAGLHTKMDILTAKRSTREELTQFHTDEYIDHIYNLTLEHPETVLNGRDRIGDRLLVGEDCPPFEGIFEFASICAGGSIAAAKRLNAGQADIAINWAGGLHHAKKREASGFCYVNDIVLGILELLRRYSRVVYIDIDVHHGDGVEEAFYATDRVLTCSFHKFGDFFPGTGDVGDRGVGKGKGYAVNVPLRSGIGDDAYRSVFRPVIDAIMNWYRPGAIVLQCGGDSLAEDKLGPFNLSLHGHADCVRYVRTFNLPMIVLGGGGYTVRNVARTWAYETAVCVGEDLPLDLPYNEYMEYFGPEYKMEVPMSNIDDQNDRAYLDKILERVMDSLNDLPFAPSVQSQPLLGPPLDAEDPLDSDMDVDASADADGSSAAATIAAAAAAADQSGSSSTRARASRFRQFPAQRRLSPRAASAALSRGAGDEDHSPHANGHHGGGAGGKRTKRRFFRNSAYDAAAGGVQAALDARRHNGYHHGATPFAPSPASWSDGGSDHAAPGCFGGWSMGAANGLTTTAGRSGLERADVVMEWDPQICY